jgi:hypothetical protein
MIERAKAWAAAVLGASARNQDRIGLTVTRSGAVKFDVANYLETAGGKAQLRGAMALAERLKLNQSTEE